MNHLRRLIAGVDEAGRGPLAGDVVAAAVILDPAQPLSGLADSKTLSVRRRTELAVQIRSAAIAWSLGSADPVEIDRLNILQAALLAMRRAVAILDPLPQIVLFDGPYCPRWDTEPSFQQRAVVRGDVSQAAISAASILAKQARDERMQFLDREYPGYGFAQHKGYPVAAHLRALRCLGPSPVHRRSFAPVRHNCRQTEELR